MPVTQVRSNLILDEGTDFNQQFTYYLDGVATALTSYTAALVVRKPRGGTPLITLANGVASPAIVFDADQVTHPGRYTVQITDALTQGLCTEHRDLNCYYDLYFTTPGTLVYKHIFGKFKIRAAVTRSWE